MIESEASVPSQVRGRGGWLTLPAAIALLVLVGEGCTTTIIGPRVPADRAEMVYLIDYGRHSSLVFPPRPRMRVSFPDAIPLVSLGVLEVEDSLADHAVEYTYGEWKWFAKNQNAWPDLVRTMLLPTQGTLGRRDLGTSLTADTLPWPIVCQSAYPIEVDRDRLAALREKIDNRFAAHADTRLTNSQYLMDFVHDDAPYSLAHNCNHVVAQWLRELGCDVRGACVVASFRIVRQEAQ